MTLFELFIMASIAVYCLTTMLNELEGPAHIFRRIRIWIGVEYDDRDHATAKNWRAEAVLCFYCLSVWMGMAITLITALFLLLGVFRGEPKLEQVDFVGLLIMPFATSGVAMFLKKFAG